MENKVTKEQLIEDFKNRLINNGIESCKEDVNLEDYEIEGSIEGFNICRNLYLPIDFENLINERRKKEIESIGSDEIRNNIKDYWKYHYSTIQIEFVYDRMKFVWILWEKGEI